MIGQSTITPSNRTEDIFAGESLPMNEPHDLRLYICPTCSATPLTYEPDSMACDGRLACQCGLRYPVRCGIPRFVPGSNYADSFGLQWNRHRRTQLDSHSGLSISRQRLFETTAWPDRMEGQVVLEAGSGAGRFTEVLLATGAKVVSFDYSSAVDANAANNGSHESLTLFQGDIYALPLPRRHFDKVLCIGVLQHTPDPELAFHKLTEYVKPGGELAVDIYAKRLTALLHWKYFLRPFTRRISKEQLYRTIERVTPPLLPAASMLRRLFGRAGTRLLPITEYSHLGLGAELARQWAVLDTFDMYAPEHDHPKTIGEVRRWFHDAGFMGTIVRRGPNGVIGSGHRAH